MKIEKIYVKFEIPERIQEFLVRFFDSKWEPDRVLNVETYLDVECTKVQCIAHKYRSFDDMFIIVNTYFPGTTEKELMHLLLTTPIYGRDGDRMSCYLAQCGTIRRIVFLFYQHSNEFHGSNPFMCSQYDSKWNWAELLNQLEIKTLPELTLYTEKHKLKENNGNSEERKEENSAGSGGGS